MASFLENYCIFVGNLEADVDGGLWTTFQNRYKSTVSAKVMVDLATSLQETRDTYVGASRIRVTVVRLRAKVEMGRPAVVNGLEEIMTVFVSGTIIALKLILLKSIALIQCEKRPSVEQAITELKESYLGGPKLRLSFGRIRLNMGAGVYYVSSYQPIIDLVYPGRLILLGRENS
ncbi:hypothetical protein G6F22_001918 [Rhizopus arrhizus]|nr:hypothetical protein G6F22_001918 [Rhizopus arrhizus]